MRNRRGSSARPTASGRSACRGRRCAPGSPPSLSGSRSTCSRRLTSAAPSGSCGSAGTRPGILERAVERGRRAKEPCATPHLGVDEKAIAKGHQYLTLVCDLDRSTVEYIAEDRKQASLEGYFTGLAADQLAGIEAIAIGHVGALCAGHPRSRARRREQDRLRSQMCRGTFAILWSVLRDVPRSPSGRPKLGI